jgi:hypothetical protein
MKREMTCDLGREMNGGMECGIDGIILPKAFLCSAKPWTPRPPAQSAQSAQLIINAVPAEYGLDIAGIRHSFATNRPIFNF